MSTNVYLQHLGIKDTFQQSDTCSSALFFSLFEWIVYIKILDSLHMKNFVIGKFRLEGVSGYYQLHPPA